MFCQTRQQRLLYYFLAGIFLAHVLFMAIKFRREFSAQIVQPSAIKVKLVQEALETLAAKHKKQIVRSEDSATQERPKESAFLSDKDRTFDRQTVSRNIDGFKEAGAGNAEVTRKSQKKTAAKKKANLKDLKLSDIGVLSGDPMPKDIQRAPASASVQGMENGNPLMEGLSSTNDYVEEVALGDFTHLNTVEYKYYGFFHRIRQKLEQFWGKSLREKADALFKAGRRIPASENLITSLQITLNTKGEIIGVKILGTSGVKELDDAAIESFNQAGPFPNPPKDLLVNGKAVIEWGFVVKS